MRETSVSAAASVRGRSAMDRRNVLEFIQRRGGQGATDEEVQDGLRMNPNTQRPRRKELEQRGEVQDSTLRRATRSGRKAIVWIATNKDANGQHGLF